LVEQRTVLRVGELRDLAGTGADSTSRRLSSSKSCWSPTWIEIGGRPARWA
jgi:hypothetical protein